MSQPQQLNNIVPPPSTRHHTSHSSNNNNNNNHHSSQRPSSSSQHKSKPQPSKSSSQSSTTPTQQIDYLNSIDSEFNCKLLLQNTLPEIPFDPKLLLIPKDLKKFIQYKPTSTLEASYRYPLFTEPQMGIPIELIDPTLYYTPKSKIPIPEEDLPLIKPLSAQDIEEKSNREANKKNITRPNVAWLRKTEYLSVTEENLLGKARPSLSGKSNFNLSPQIHSQSFTESPSEIIENTFESIKEMNFVHPTNPSLKPLEILPVFPDFELWSNNYTEVNFDSDPFEMPPPNLTPTEKKEFIATQQIAREKGIIKSATDKYVYFISPTMITTEEKQDEDLDDNNNNNNSNGHSIKRFKLDIRENDNIEEENELNYNVQKVFTMDITSDSNNGNYFLIVKKDAVYYNPLRSKVSLKRVKSGEEKTLVHTKLGRPEYVKYEKRDPNPEEIAEKDLQIQSLLQEEKMPFSNKRKHDE